MKTLTLKLDNAIFEETDLICGKLKMARNRYINEALAAFNAMSNRKLLKTKLQNESKRVRPDSMEILKELERMVDDL